MRNKTIKRTKKNKRTKTTKSKRSNRKSQRKYYGGSSPLYNAAKIGDIEKVIEFVTNDVPINEMSEQLFDDGMSGSRFTPIQVAARYGHYNVVRYLHEHGAPLDENHYITGESLLILAVKGENIDTVQYLLNNGMDINYPSQNGIRNMPLFYARTPTMRTLLISQGANLDKRNNFGDFARDSELYKKKRNVVTNIPSASTVRKMPLLDEHKVGMYKYFG